MKKILTLAIILSTVSGYAQMRINAAGLGFDFNGGSNLKHSGLVSAMKGNGVDILGEDNTISVNRVMVAYRLNFKPENNSFFKLETDFLQGTEYQYYYDWDYNYSSPAQGDTVRNQTVSYDNNGAILGLRLKARFSTPSERRFHYNFGLGIEGLYVYNNNTDGYVSTDYETWNGSQFVWWSEEDKIDTQVLDNYTSFNFIQQAGVAFRLGKDESSFPLNKTYLEGTFHVLTNFTNINNVTETHRTYGLGLALVYEFR